MSLSVRRPLTDPSLLYFLSIGVYRNACEITMRILRENKDSLMSVLEAFIHDPLVEWENDKRKLVRFSVPCPSLKDARLTHSSGVFRRTTNDVPSLPARVRTTKTRPSTPPLARLSSRSSASSEEFKPATSLPTRRHPPRRLPSATKSRPSSRRRPTPSIWRGCTSGELFHPLPPSSKFSI
jgi:hypothetical protein